MEDDFVLDLDLLPHQQQAQPSARKRKNFEPTTNANPAPEFLALPRQSSSSMKTKNDHPPSPPQKKPHNVPPKPSNTKPLSAFLDELPSPAPSTQSTTTDVPVADEIAERSYPARSFPRYHDYNIDEVTTPSDWGGSTTTTAPDKATETKFQQIQGFEVSKIKVLINNPKVLNLKGTTREEKTQALQNYIIRFQIDRKDSEVDVLQYDGSHKIPRTLHIMVPSTRKFNKSGKAVCIVFRGDCRGFRFSDCIEYQVLWHAAGIERMLACGILRLSDVIAQTCSHVEVRVGREDYFRPIGGELEQYYQNHTRYALIVPDKENDSRTCFTGRTMLEWAFFLKNAIPISKTSLLPRKHDTSDDETESEEEEGEIRV